MQSVPKQLATGLDKLVNGSTTLKNGTSQLAKGTSALPSSTEKLDNGVRQILKELQNSTPSESDQANYSLTYRVHRQESQKN